MLFESFRVVCLLVCLLPPGHDVATGCFLSAIDRSVFEMTEKNLVILVGMSENTG